MKPTKTLIKSLKSGALITLLAFVCFSPSAKGQVLINLNRIDGSWAYGATEWNGSSDLGYVNDTADLSRVNSILTGTYVYQSTSSTTANGIYNYPFGIADVVFSVAGGTETILDTLSVLSSRSYSTTTSVTLDYSNNGGVTWINELTSTTGALGWVDLGTGGAQTETINLALNGVTGNAFRLGFNGDQISLHTLTLSGTAVVPEPSTWAMMLGGLAIIGYIRYRRSRVTSKKLTSGLLAVPLSLAFLTGARAELITNGSFETGDFSGWTVQDNAYQSVSNISVLSDNAYSGTYDASFHSTAGSGYAIISQTFATLMGSQYTLTFDLQNIYTSPGDASNQFSVQLGGSNVLLLLQSPSFSYTQYTDSFTASSSLSSVSFEGFNNNGSYRLDNVSVSLATTPEPSTWAMLLGGLGLLAFCHRRKLNA